MRLKETIMNLFAGMAPEYIAALLIKLGLIALVFVLVHKFRPRWKYLAYGVLVILLVRIVLFGQPWSWGLYKDHLTVDDLGWRQQSELYVEYYKFFRNPPKKFLAVGSSQTFAVYRAYSKDHTQLITFNLAGMTPLDCYLYRKYIAARKPGHVLLYLSEFDLAKEPRLDASKGAPAQGFGFLKIFPVLSKAARESDMEISLKEMITGEFLPEYKYAFIFKGFLEKMTGKDRALQVSSLYDQLSPDTDRIRKDAAQLVEDMDERWIKYNVYFLRKFLSYAQSRSLKVIIVEGQYNPAAYAPKTLALNRMTRQELERLAGEFDRVQFIPRENVMAFSSEDYSDVMHVKPESGYRFVEKLLADLGNVEGK